VALSAASGWHLVDRPLLDLSLSGAALSVQWWEWGRVKVGEDVTLTLTLPQGEYVLHGCVQAPRRERRLLTKRLAVQFSSDVAYGGIQPSLCHFLLQLAEVVDAPFFQNRRAMSVRGSR